jgi:O-antigen ligase
MQRRKFSPVAPWICERAARCLWVALFLILVTYSGVLRLSWLAVPRITNQFLTLTILVLCCVLPLPLGHWRGQPRLISAMWRAWLRLPLAVLCSAVGWSLCMAWATYHSTMPGVSLEVFGGIVWALLLAALAYGYAACGLRQVEHISGGILAALDAALLLGAAQYIAYWSDASRDTSFQAQHNVVISFLNHPNDFGHYLGLLLPLALWDAVRAFRAGQDRDSGGDRSLSEKARLMPLARRISQQAGWEEGISPARSHSQQSSQPISKQKTRVVPHRLAWRLGCASVRLGRAWQGLWRWWRAARPGVVIAMCVATTSRSTWLAVAVGLVFYALLWRRIGTTTASWQAADQKSRTKTLWRPYAIPLAVGLMLSVAVAVPQSAWIVIRLGQMAQPRDLGGDIGRGTIWRNAVAMIRQRPGTGWGPGAFTVNYPQFIKPAQVREIVAHAHNTYLHRAVEEGLPSLCCWLILVLVVWSRGVFALLSRASARPVEYPAQPSIAGLSGESSVSPHSPVGGERDGLLLALCCGLFAYGICGVFVMTERTPTMAVHFYIVLALIAALAWGMDFNRDHLPGVSTRRRLLTAVVMAALPSTSYYLPWLLRSDLAHLNFDEAMAAKSLATRVALLRHARDLDPGQPIYWAQLGLARHMLEGPSTARAVTNLYRAALQRAPADGLHWHNIAILYRQAGDYTNAIRNETRAVFYDPTYSLYHLSLAQDYAIIGDAPKSQAHRHLAEHFAARDAQMQQSTQGLAHAQLGGRYRRVVTTPEIISLPNGDTAVPPSSSREKR